MNGSLEDLAIAAEIVACRTVPPRTRLIVMIPASQQIYREALRHGHVESWRLRAR
jgi:homoaconitase/3-isopropylmalate dehydratase large subunit